MQFNRAFKYGDGLFETIRVSNGKILFVEYHFKRLSLGLNLLKMHNSTNKLTFSEFQNIIHQHLKTKKDKNLRVRITFYREQGGLYTPHKNSFAYFVESSILSSSSYKLNRNGLKIGLCSKVRLPVDNISNLKTISALPYVLAAIEKKENKWDDCLILNSNGMIAESVAANVFMIKGNALITPALSEGCIMGVMRSNVLNITKKLNLQKIEKTLFLEELEDADELFLTNTIKGIQWVEQIEGVDNNLKNHYAKKIIKELNTNIKCVN
ncbi:MAG: aminotransferase class IV [Saprospiraceae bacterium]|nr:aminotransferase class IV [Saprospiraceae bacterium]